MFGQIVAEVKKAIQRSQMTDEQKARMDRAREDARNLNFTWEVEQWFALRLYMFAEKEDERKK